MNAAGGPVGGGPVMNQAGARYSMDDDYQTRLNTYIYDYLLKNERYDVARIFCKSFDIKIADPTKSSPGRVNGADDSMDADSKDDIKKPMDLPTADIPSQNGCFLFDWWCQFWDIYGTRMKQTSTRNTAVLQEYLNHNIRQQQQRSVTQQRMPGNGDLNIMRMQGYQNMMNMQQPNGMAASEMAKRAMQNRGNMTPQQLAQARLQMERQGSQMDMNGQGRGSPSMANAPSPSKRPRLDDGTFNGGQPMGPAGRGQPISGSQMNNMSAVAGGPNAAGGMLLTNGITPDMQQQQMPGFSGAPSLQQKQLEAMNAANVPQQTQIGVEGMGDFAMNAQRLGTAGGANPTGGNHALQDYQMQLMLLEQQNKKRLLMARQEQENTAHPGQGGAAGTPKMSQGGVPGSPMPDMQNRGSPAPGQNFDPSQAPPPGMNAHQFYQLQMSQAQAHAQAQAQAQMGRPPSSHPTMQNIQNMNPAQIEQMRRQGMMANGAGQWPAGGPQQQMMQQAQGQPQQNPAQMGTPQQRGGNMPPPPAPASQDQQRTQPSSPAQPQQAPPTPSQTNKANPKNKKDTAGTKSGKKNASKKSGATGATPAAENVEPPTPTPSTPITPMHPKSFGNQIGSGPQAGNPGANAVAAGQQAAQQQASAPPPSATDPSAGMGGLDVNQNSSFMFDEAGGDANFNLDFSIDPSNTDVLDNFDFEALLNTEGFNLLDGGELGVEGV